MTIIRVTDIESGGFDKPHGVCEIAWTQLEMVAADYMITKQASTLLRPHYPMSSGAIHTHGITDAMVADAPSEDFASNFLHWSQEPGPYTEERVSYIVAHNLDFEKKWLDLRGARGICTLKCARKFIPGLKSYKNAEIFRALRLQPTVEGYVIDPLHRALPDTTITAAIVMHLLIKHSAEELADATEGKKTGIVLSYGKFKGCRIDDEKVVDADWLRFILNKSTMHGGHKAAAREELLRRGEKLED